MGLSIHYELQSDARRASKARRLVEELRCRAMDVRRRWLRNVVDWTGDECDPKAHRTARWKRLAEQATRWVEHEGVRLPVRPERMFGFALGIGDGTEQAGFALAMYPESITDPETGIVLPTGLKGWCWRASCKTQHGREDNLVDFVFAHQTLIKVLDCAKELGILATVADDGDYWETRDVEVLKANLKEWEEIVAGRARRKHIHW